HVDAVKDYGRLYFLDEELLDRRYDIYHQLRETQKPIFWSEGIGRWVCTGYAESREALRDPRLSNETLPAALKQLPEEIRASLDADVPLLRQANTIMISRDDPDHARLRALVNKAFTPRMIERQRPQMEQLAHKLLEDMEQREQPDFIRDFATPFPMMIIAAMIG